MKISQIFNEKKSVGVFAYSFFKSYHFLKRLINRKPEFELLGERPTKFYIPYHPIPESNLFGHIEMLKKYIGYQSALVNIHVQHGVILGDLVQKIMIQSFANTIVTYSLKRKKIIENKTQKNVVAIGPYIKYAKSRLNAIELQKMKADFGKTLLVFPAHSSVDRTKINFDQISLIEKIKEIKQIQGIRTVLINLFYTDCTPDSINFYENEGFKVCSAGYWLSENFLPNLKTIIELSDLTMSNRVGTHVGYSICLGKPHYIYKQHYKEDFIGKKGQEDLKQVNENEELDKLDSDRIEQVFADDSFVVTEAQNEIVDEYWGNKIFYSPEEMLRILTL